MKTFTFLALCVVATMGLLAGCAYSGQGKTLIYPTPYGDLVCAKTPEEITIDGSAFQALMSIVANPLHTPATRSWQEFKDALSACENFLRKESPKI